MTVTVKCRSRIHGSMRISFVGMQIIEAMGGVSAVQKPQTIGPEKSTGQSRRNKSEYSNHGRDDGGCE